jgi:hypothetical protein
MRRRINRDVRAPLHYSAIACLTPFLQQQARREKEARVASNNVPSGSDEQESKLCHLAPIDSDGEARKSGRVLRALFNN